MVEDSGGRDAPLRAAETWLGRVDSGDADASHAAAAGIFRAAVTPARWAESLRAARGPLGPVLGRTPRSWKYASELPGAPDGEYVVIEYDTEFERKRRGIETVVVTREPDGEWRACGYWIR
ncbi:MAG: DUF4019 domain-containing protein [Gemmatimonadetes bacterium]|nr:DUF4019 domain-containing protein [Gemmatimonadota bacterium]